MRSRCFCAGGRASSAGSAKTQRGALALDDVDRTARNRRRDQQIERLLHGDVDARFGLPQALVRLVQPWPDRAVGRGHGRGVDRGEGRRPARRSAGSWLPSAGAPRPARDVVISSCGASTRSSDGGRGAARHAVDRPGRLVDQVVGREPRGQLGPRRQRPEQRPQVRIHLVEGRQVGRRVQRHLGGRQRSGRCAGAASVAGPAGSTTWRARPRRPRARPRRRPARDSTSASGAGASGGGVTPSRSRSRSSTGMRTAYTRRALAGPQVLD